MREVGQRVVPRTVQTVVDNTDSNVLDNAARGGLSAAILTNPINLKGMTGGFVVIFMADFLLQLLNFVGEEFDRTTAVGTNHVVMAPPVVLVLVASNAIVKCYFAREPAFRQQFQGAVDRGIANL